MNLSDKKWTAVFWFFITLMLVALVGLFVHELGHGITATALGGKFTSLYILPGIQVWPHFGQPYPNGWSGYIGWVEYNYGFNWNPDGWQPGLVTLMGSGSNLLIAALALVALWVFQPRRCLRFFLVAEAMMFVDLLLYTFLPLVGLRHFFIIGGISPEPLEGAIQLGLPSWLFIALVGVVSALMSWGLIRYVRRHPLWES